MRDPFQTFLTATALASAGGSLAGRLGAASRAAAEGRLADAAKAAVRQPAVKPRLITTGDTQVGLHPSANPTVRAVQAVHDKVIQHALNTNPDSRLGAYAAKRVGGSIMETARYQQRLRDVPANLLNQSAQKIRRAIPGVARVHQAALEQDAIPFLGPLRLSQIRQSHLNELAARIAARGVAPATVRVALAAVKVLFASALAAGDIRVNPAAGWRARYAQPAVDQVDEVEVVKALKDDELQAVIAEIPAEWRAFYSFLAQTGLRISEAIELRWRDVDFGTNTIKVARRFYRGHVAAPKSKYGRRTIRLATSLSRTLWPLQGAPDELVFTSAKGQRIDQSNLMTRVLKPTAARAGVGEWIKDERGKLRAETWVGHRTFRHTCATMLFRHGFNAKQVQVWLGHHSPAFTLATYVHLLPADLPELPSVLDALTGGNAGATQPTETHLNREPATVRESAQILAAVRAV